MHDLQQLIDRKVSVVTHDGRYIIGQLVGFDQTTNLILQNAIERIFPTLSSDSLLLEEIPLGLYLLRGDNIAIVGEVNLELDAAINWNDLIANTKNQIRDIPHVTF